MEGEWPETTLGAIAAKDGYGLVDGPFGSNLPASSYTDSGVPVIRGANLTLGTRRFVADEFVFVSSETATRLARSLCRPHDIVFTKKGTLGQTGLVPSDGGYQTYLLSSNQMKLTVDRQLADPLYVYYFVSSPKSREKIVRDSEATGVPKTNVTYLRDFPIALPPLPDQRAIAHILGTLDDKIELNRRMSETLEAMARALFTSWFVDLDPVRAKAGGRDPGLPQPLADLFPARLVDSELGEVPEGWEVGPLSTHAELMIGGDWGRDAARDGDVPIRCLRGVDIDRIRTTGWSDAPLRFISSSSLEKRAPSPVDVLVEGSGECGRAIAAQFLDQLYVEPVVYSNFCKRFRSLSPESAFYVEYLLNELVRTGEMKNFVTGTAMPNLDHKGLLAGHWVISPPPQVLEVFSSFVSSARGKLYCEESRALARLRDALLPKLMSGELRVEEPETAFVGVGA
jgi:type I restriction enzyme, S subunit